MKRLMFVSLAIMLMLLASFTGADAKLRVVATIPDLADMARNIGGDLLEIKSLATGVEDIHAVPMKPSFAVVTSGPAPWANAPAGKFSLAAASRAAVPPVALRSWRRLRPRPGVWVMRLVIARGVLCVFAVVLRCEWPSDW